ncbi:hypothetical protein, partial [Bradyrhizobium sp. Leo121]|uniref:hypothetical protein n=1 Tax=Bradyrhizobium sp. Leo121 TaxID=1571195 RepID=UPI001028C5C2
MIADLGDTIKEALVHIRDTAAVLAGTFTPIDSALDKVAYKGAARLDRKARITILVIGTVDP